MIEASDSEERVTAPELQAREGVVGEPARKLNWLDALLPTLLTLMGLGVLSLLTLPWILALLLQLAIDNPHNPAIPSLPFAVFGMLFALTVSIALGAKSWNRQTSTSYVVVPLVPLLAIISLGVAAYQPPENPVQAAQEKHEFEEKMRDPNFIMNLKPPVTLSEKAEIKSGIYGPPIPADPNTKLGPGSGVEAFSADQIHAVLKNFRKEFENDIARSPATSIADLTWIAEHGDLYSRAAVVTNSKTPDDVLRKLLADQDPQVVYFAQHAAAQRLCDADVLRSIWEKKSDPNVKSNYPHFLASDPELLGLMANNPCTPAEVMAAMAASPDDNINYAARAALEKRSSEGK